MLATGDWLVPRAHSARRLPPSSKSRRSSSGWSRLPIAGRLAAARRVRHALLGRDLRRRLVRLRLLARHLAPEPGLRVHGRPAPRSRTPRSSSATACAATTWTARSSSRTAGASTITFAGRGRSSFERSNVRRQMRERRTTRFTARFTCGPSLCTSFLGFMTKFVAALFLPMILGLTALVVTEHRRALARGWRTWALAAVTAIVLIAPWFVFASIRFGPVFWQTILLACTSTSGSPRSLDPGTCPPLALLSEPDVRILGIRCAGADDGRVRDRDRMDGAALAPSVLVLVIWLVLPLAAISAVTSKLYHYAFPFLPALALMGAYSGRSRAGHRLGAL